MYQAVLNPVMTAWLAVSARAIWMQLYQQAVRLKQQEQRHKADQIIAWKNSALGLNEFAMQCNTLTSIDVF